MSLLRLGEDQSRGEFFTEDPGKVAVPTRLFALKDREKPCSLGTLSYSAANHFQDSGR
jgi:hypothetical protein